MELSLDSNYPALVIFDRFKGQCTERIFSHLVAHKIHWVVVPANCTDRLQPLDVSVNKSVKDFMRGQFQHWYSNQVCERLAKDTANSDISVDLRMSIVRPIEAQWLINMFNYFQEKPTIIVNGFTKSGILPQ